MVLRANIPAAALSTLVTNPVTFGPIYYGAYQLGVWVTGSKERPKTLDPADSQARDEKQNLSIWERITQLGKPLLVGLSITAVLMGLLTYGLITLAWRDAGTQSIGWPAVKLAEAEAGTADPWLAMIAED